MHACMHAAGWWLTLPCRPTLPPPSSGSTRVARGSWPGYSQILLVQCATHGTKLTSRQAEAWNAAQLMMLTTATAILV